MASVILPYSSAKPKEPNRKYSKEQILKVLGGNLMRAFAEAEKVSREK